MHEAPSHHLITTEQMHAADRATIAAGTSGAELMENAGAACVRAIVERVTPGPTLVLCGPGNNGGDGFVVARLLQTRGWPVTVALLGAREDLAGDAAAMAARWHGEDCPLEDVSPDGAELVVDALLGAGLSRPLDGAAARLVEAVNAAGATVCAVDIPSGVDGDTGEVRGCAVQADFTVTFFCRKPGHVLYPGRGLCGDVIVADIGIAASVLEEFGSTLSENRPAVWHAHLPMPAPDGHKYQRGHVVVVTGDELHTGAARLGARAALRIGAGVVTVASPPDAAGVNAVHLTAIMVREFDGADALEEMLSDRRPNAVLIGPAAGIGAATRFNVEAILAGGAAAVLDADALTSFEATPTRLFEAIAGRAGPPVVLTPHEGEFRRLFADQAAWGSKLERVAKAARTSHAVVVLKGADTVIAAPDGRLAINAHASPWLATAGTGDVLAGMIAGLLAQGMPVFEAACAAAWMHGDAAIRFGCGLIAEDLSEQLPAVLRALHEMTPARDAPDPHDETE